MRTIILASLILDTLLILLCWQLFVLLVLIGVVVMVMGARGAKAER